jgi:hypothetical protein
MKQYMGYTLKGKYYEKTDIFTVHCSSTEPE